MSDSRSALPATGTAVDQRCVIGAPPSRHNEQAADPERKDLAAVTETLQAGSAGSDAELITQVRAGDRRAYGELYTRHSAAALTLARQFSRSPAEADDLVSESFARVLDTLISGGGPDSAFRAYLFTTLRNTAYDRSRKDKRLQFTDDVEAHDSPVDADDPVLLKAENTLVGKAFTALPERWQAVLWYTQVDGLSPAEAGVLLGMSANAVTSLAYRAREGLREAYLQAHLADTAAESCRTTVDRLGAWARGGLSKREQAQVDAHLSECDRCRALAAELTEINSGIRGLIAPLLLGGAAVGYLAATSATPPLVLASAGTLFAAHTAGTAGTTAGAATAGTAAAATAGASGAAGGHLAGVATFFTRPWVLAGGGAVAAAVAAVVVAVAVTGNPSPSTAAPPAAITSPATSAAVSPPTSATSIATGAAPGQTGGAPAGSPPAVAPSSAAAAGTTTASPTASTSAATSASGSASDSAAGTPPAAPPPIVVTPIPGTRAAGATTAPATTPASASSVSSAVGSAPSSPSTSATATSTPPTTGTPSPTPAQLSAPRFTIESINAAAHAVAGRPLTVSFTVQNSGQTDSSPQTVGVSAPSGVSLTGGSGVVVSGSAAPGLRRASALFTPLDAPAAAPSASPVTCSSASCSYTVPANSTLTVTLQLTVAPGAVDGIIALSAGTSGKPALSLKVEPGLTLSLDPPANWTIGAAADMTLIGTVKPGVTDVGVITLPTHGDWIWFAPPTSRTYASSCVPSTDGLTLECRAPVVNGTVDFGYVSATAVMPDGLAASADLPGGRTAPVTGANGSTLTAARPPLASGPTTLSGPFDGVSVGAPMMRCDQPLPADRGTCQMTSDTAPIARPIDPDGATIVFAELVWAATAADPNAKVPPDLGCTPEHWHALDCLRLRVGSADHWVEGQPLPPLPNTQGELIVRAADVTSLLTGATSVKSDKLSVSADELAAMITTPPSGLPAMAAWNLLVVWANPQAQGRTVTIDNAAALSDSTILGGQPVVSDGVTIAPAGPQIQRVQTTLWAVDVWADKSVDLMEGRQATAISGPLTGVLDINGVQYATGFQIWGADSSLLGGSAHASVVFVNQVADARSDRLWIGPTLVVRQPG
jgi:RNA polymerase sigma factor (sigma-70 family)